MGNWESSKYESPKVPNESLEKQVDLLKKIDEKIKIISSRIISLNESAIKKNKPLGFKQWNYNILIHCRLNFVNSSDKYFDETGKIIAERTHKDWEKSDSIIFHEDYINPNGDNYQKWANVLINCQDKISIEFKWLEKQTQINYSDFFVYFKSHYTELHSSDNIHTILERTIQKNEKWEIIWNESFSKRIIIWKERPEMKISPKEALEMLDFLDKEVTKLEIQRNTENEKKEKKNIKIPEIL